MIVIQFQKDFYFWYFWNHLWNLTNKANEFSFFLSNIPCVWAGLMEGSWAHFVGRLEYVTIYYTMLHTLASMICMYHCITHHSPARSIHYNHYECITLYFYMPYVYAIYYISNHIRLMIHFWYVLQDSDLGVAQGTAVACCGTGKSTRTWGE